jgi:hypothetical protein
MFNVLQLVGDVFKSNIVTGIINALLVNVTVQQENPEAAKQPIDIVTKTAAIHSIGTAANAVVDAIVPNLKTWTPEELTGAQKEWAATQDAGLVNANTAFAAGVAWALSHQTTALTTGIANAVAAHASLLKTVEVDAVQVAEAAATGGTGAAVAAVAVDVVQAVESAETAKASEPAVESAEAAPSTSAPANQA